MSFYGTLTRVEEIHDKKPEDEEKEGAEWGIRRRGN